jgi:hypothetical protein
VSVLHPRDVTTKQPCAPFNRALGQAFQFPELFEPGSYIHIRRDSLPGHKSGVL